MSFLLTLFLLGDLDAQKKLIEEYNAKEHVGYEYKPTNEEMKRSRIPFEKSVQRDKSAALKAYLELIEEFPQSPNVHVDYVFFLDRLGRHRQASAHAAEAAKAFPHDLRLQILRDYYAKISQTRSRKRIRSLKRDMDALLAAWTQIQVEHRRK